MIPIAVAKIANLVGISASLLYSVCFIETGFTDVNNFNDGNGRGSFGVCQTSLEVARSFFPWADRLALQQRSFNLLVAALYLKQLNNRYNDISDTISAYNAGQPTIVNTKYIDKVLKVLYNINKESL